MTSWAPLDVAIGLFVVYFVLSLLASTINEAISAMFRLRARFLEQWLVSVMGSEQTSAFLRHPLVESTSSRRNRGPSYIATEVFSAAALTLGATREMPKTIDGAIAALPSQKLKDVATALVAEGTHDVADLRAQLERWYDNSMERVSGWYKRRVQLILAIVGLVLAILLNADTLQVVNSLWSDKTVRAAVVAEAGQAVRGHGSDLQGAADQVKAIRSLDVPLGWKLSKGDPRDLPHGLRSWVGKVLGLVLTALALTLGAPFWFDLLSKIARVRFTGAPPPARGSVRTGDGEQKRSGPGSPQ